MARTRSQAGRRQVEVPVQQQPVGRRQVEVPVDPVNEQVVLAAAAVLPAGDPERRKLLGAVPAEAFYARGHAEAWQALRELERQGLEFDPATVQQLTGGQVQAGYLEELVQARPAAPPNLGYHLECLQWDRARVEAVRGPVAQLLGALADPLAEPERVRAHARQVAAAFAGHGALRWLRDSPAVVRDQVAAIRERRGGGRWYPYGVDGLDVYGPEAGPKRAGRRRLIPGAAPGKVTVVTGVSGSGKTTLVARMLVAWADLGWRVLVGAWEQGAGPTLELCAAVSLGMSRSALQEGLFGQEEEEQLRAEMERLGASLRFFELPFGRQKGEKHVNDRALDTIHEHVAMAGCQVFVADLWRRAVRQFEPDEEEHALYRQQAIAQETGVHCLLVHQQRLKEVELRADKRPTREGLKGSGAWVEVPDTILGVHREALWKAVDDVVLEVDVLKQRYGPWPLAVECEWDPDTGWIGAGREVPYVRAGQVAEVDGFLDAPAPAREGGVRGKRRRGG